MCGVVCACNGFSHGLCSVRPFVSFFLGNLQNDKVRVYMYGYECVYVCMHIIVDVHICICIYIRTHKVATMEAEMETLQAEMTAAKVCPNTHARSYSCNQNVFLYIKYKHNMCASS